MVGAANVGVSPGSFNMGQVVPGTTEVVDFYIVTASEETLLVQLEPETVIFDTVALKNNFSEENVLSWIDIINNPVELEPEYDVLETEGGNINSHRKVSFLLKIPRDAEPGDHMFKIKPIPLSDQGDIGNVGSKVVAITSVKVMFKVPGDAVRKGAILDVELGNDNENSVEIKTYFQNTGSVTISAKGLQRLYDKEGNLVGELQLAKKYIEPKQIATFKGILSTKGIEAEDYDVYTIIDYGTGEIEKSSKITLSKATTMAIKQEGDMTIFILIILILIVSIIIYRRAK
ncbi:MAG: hypothetical protein JW700_01085 [Candidatus Aenigmarchaeota archaeon]|nr:hypothetical protein [Candidatus Aenigmarchaeota archaeon]